jgi:hypothetical protein
MKKEEEEKLYNHLIKLKEFTEMGRIKWARENGRYYTYTQSTYLFIVPPDEYISKMFPDYCEKVFYELKLGDALSNIFGEEIYAVHEGDKCWDCVRSLIDAIELSIKPSIKAFTDKLSKVINLNEQ